ncbi:MAG: VanZ family protein [candidate division WOR-3 bacterium]|jgi:hypothetical protein
MKNRWLVLLLIIWSIGILFPYYFIHLFSLVYKTRFDWFFKSDVIHIIMHIFLYAVLAWLIAVVFSNKKILILSVIGILIALGVSILQEFIQLITLKSPVGLDDVLDTFVDVSGAVIGIIVFRWQWSRKEQDVK